MVMRRCAPARGKTHFEQRDRGRAVKHLSCIAAGAGDIAQRLFDGGEVIAQGLKLLARGVHRVCAFAGLGEAGHELVYFHGNFLRFKRLQAHSRNALQ